MKRQPRAVSSSPTRGRSSRRDRRRDAGAAAEAAPRAADTPSSASAARTRSRSTCAFCPPRIGTSRPRSRRGGSARTCSIACTWSSVPGAARAQRHPAPRRALHHQAGAAHQPSGRRDHGRRAGAASAPLRLRRATCASWRTSSSRRWCSPRAMPSTSARCRRWCAAACLENALALPATMSLPNLLEDLDGGSIQRAYDKSSSVDRDRAPAGDQEAQRALLRAGEVRHRRHREPRATRARRPRPNRSCSTTVLSPAAPGGVIVHAEARGDAPCDGGGGDERRRGRRARLRQRRGRWPAPAARSSRRDPGGVPAISKSFHGQAHGVGRALRPEQDEPRTTLPLGARVRVARVGGPSVIVTVDDRCGCTHGRIIDVSEVATRKLDMNEIGCCRCGWRSWGARPVSGSTQEYPTALVGMTAR